MNKDTKIVKIICCISCCINLVLAIGFAGSLEVNAVEFREAVTIMCVCMSLFFLSVHGITAMNRIEDARNKKVR